MRSGQLSSVLRYIHKLASWSMSGALTDGCLLEHFVAQRDEDAFAALVRRHGPLVLSVCRRVLRDAHDAEDAFQATFLVLARKASSLKNRDALDSWLFKVAYRIALRARAATERRRASEREVESVPVAGVKDEAARQDLRAALDEEVERLPEKYRAAFVLCYLEGKTNAEAARQLGCPTGTIDSRLARARERLRIRLTRRGFGPGVGLLLALLSAEAIAALPGALVDPTVAAAMAFSANGAAPGAVAPQIVTLAEGALKTMFVKKLRIALAGFLAAVTLSTGIGLLASRMLAQERSAAKKNEVPKPGVKSGAGPKTGKLPASQSVGRKTVQHPAPDPERVKREIRERLHDPITGMPFSDWVQLSLLAKWVRDQTGVNVVLDTPALREQGITAQTAAKPMRFVNVRLSTALSLMLDPLGLTYQVGNDALLITSKRKLHRDAPLGLGRSKRTVYTALPDSDWPAQEILERLNDKMTIEFDAPPLSDLVEFLRDYTNLNVVLDTAALREQGVTDQTPVAVKVQGAPLKSFLTLALDQLNATYLIENDVLLITSKVKATERRHGRAAHPAKLDPDSLSKTDIRNLQTLREPISINIEGMPLEDVVYILWSLTSVDIVLDLPALRKQGITKTTPVTLQVFNVRLGSALALILDQFNLTYEVRNDALFITSQVKASEERRTAESWDSRSASPDSTRSVGGLTAPGPVRSEGSRISEREWKEMNQKLEVLQREMERLKAEQARAKQILSREPHTAPHPAK